MLCGYLPFEDPDTGALYKKIMAGTYKIATFVSAEARDLIAKMCAAVAAATTRSSLRCSRSALRTGSAGSPSSRAVNLLYVNPRHVIDGRLPLASTRSE